MRPSIPSSSATEALTRNFYEWERHGRGWQLWDNPVALEPPFRPFFHYSMTMPTRDDGRSETPLSIIATAAQWLLSGAKRSQMREMENIDPSDLAEPDVAVYEDDSPLVEIEVVLPPPLKVSHSFASQFLVALTYCRNPLSFEIIGTKDAITVQLVCREEDKYPLREQLNAYFPEATLAERTGFLDRTWSLPKSENSVIVDFGVSEEFIRPLKSLGGFDTDPLIPVAGALASLEAGEVGLLQVLFEPVRYPWAESILRSVTDDTGKPLFANAPEMMGFAKQKISQPLYAAVFRVASRSPSENRAWRIVKALGAAFAQFTNPGVNELFPLHNEGYPDWAHEQDLVARQSRRNGMLLNSEELVSLVHLPSASVRSQKLKRTTRKSKAAPDLALNHDLMLGENEHDGETRQVTLSPEQRIRHSYVIGASGTGKSTFLLNMICQDIERGDGLAVLDPHGDLIDQILERIPEERYGDVVLFDPSDEEYPIGFNILSAHSEIEKHLLSSDLVSVFRRLSTSWGDQMTSVLGNAILSFLESDRGGTLADLRRFLVEKEYRQEFLKTVKDLENVYYWQREFPLLAGRAQAPLLTRLDTFLRPRLIRYMVAQKENKLDFADIMNGQKIFLGKLAQGAIGEENAYLLGTLLVSKFHQLTLARQDMKAAQRRPFYFYIDEFHNFVTPSMASILAGARKYRLGLVLAHQELRQLGLGTSEIASAVISNPYTRVCFRLGDQDAGKLADGFSFFEAKDLQNLGTGEALCRMERAEFDFNLRTFPLAAVDPAVASERTQRITHLSRQRYATRREVVEAALAAGAPDLGVGDEAAKRRAEPAKKRAAPAPAAGDPSAQIDATSDEPPGKLLSNPSSEPPSEPTIAPPEPTPTPPPPPPAMPTSMAEPTLAYQPAPPAEPSTKIKTEPPQEATPGRGGRDHKHLQQLIKRWAEGMNWRADLEKPTPDGAGSIDVALQKGDTFIACEISIASPIAWEIGNIKKCLKAGLEHIISVSDDPSRLTKIRESAEKNIPANDLAKVQFLDTAALFRFIEETSAKMASREKRSKGFKMKVTYHAADKTVKKARKQEISESVAESIDALRQRKAKKKEKEKESSKEEE